MDKVKKFLEANVQWLAIALGVGFLGWMIWGYVLQKPVSSSVGNNSSASPGEVDRLIWDGPGEKLESEIKSPTVPPDIGPKEDYPTKIADLFRKPSAEPGVLPVPYTPIPAPLAQGSDAKVPTPNGANQIQSLPKAPPLVNLLVSSGHSNVPAPLPPQNPGAAAAAPPGPPQAVDRNWRTVSATFPTAALAKAFKEAGIAPGTPLSNTAILRVVLMRQDRNADNSWPDDSVFTEIQPLDINPLDPVPPLLAPVDVQTAYLDYATKNFIPIARPPFYQVMQGDVWYEPGTPNPNEAKAVVENAFDPAHPENYTGDPNMLLPSEKTAFDEAKRQQTLKEKNQNNRNNNPGQRPPGNFNPIPGSGPGGYQPPLGGHPGAGVVDDPERIAGDFGNPMMPIPGGYNPNPYGAPPMPGFAPANNAAPPTGSFDPSLQAEFKVWVHDPTVQAGKTYRYRLKYIISNPVARTTGMCAPALSNQFYIESEKSAWTDAVSVESDTNFYAVALKHGIQFNVFKWKNGIWQMQDVTANPGDMVGSVVTDTTTGVTTDFSTGWTLVDIREDPSDSGNRLLVLVSDNGTVLKRELASDAHSPEYRKLWQLYNLNKPAPAVAGGGPGNPNP